MTRIRQLWTLVGLCTAACASGLKAKTVPLGKYSFPPLTQQQTVTWTSKDSIGVRLIEVNAPQSIEMHVLGKVSAREQ